MQDLRWDQGACSSDPSVFESKQGFFERDQSIVTHCNNQGQRTVGDQTPMNAGYTFLCFCKGLSANKVGDVREETRVDRVKIDAWCGVMTFPVQYIEVIDPDPDGGT